MNESMASPEDTVQALESLGGRSAGVQINPRCLLTVMQGHDEAQLPHGKCRQGPFGIHWFLIAYFYPLIGFPFFVFFGTSCTLSSTSAAQSSVVQRPVASVASLCAALETARGLGSGQGSDGIR